MRVFICSMLIFLSFVFIVLIMAAVLLKLLMPKKKCDYFICIPCDENAENVKNLAYCARLKLNLCGECENNVLVIVDNGLSDKEKRETLEMCSQTDGITVVKKEDLKDFINGRI